MRKKIMVLAILAQSTVGLAETIHFDGASQLDGSACEATIELDEDKNLISAQGEAMGVALGLNILGVCDHWLLCRFERNIFIGMNENAVQELSNLRTNWSDSRIVIKGTFPKTTNSTDTFTLKLTDNKLEYITTDKMGVGPVKVPIGRSSFTCIR